MTSQSWWKGSCVKDSSSMGCQKLGDHWSAYVQKSRNSEYKAVLRFFGKQFFLCLKTAYRALAKVLTVSIYDKYILKINVVAIQFFVCCIFSNRRHACIITIGLLQAYVLPSSNLE